MKIKDGAKDKADQKAAQEHLDREAERAGNQWVLTCKAREDRILKDWRKG